MTSSSDNFEIDDDLGSSSLAWDSHRVYGSILHLASVLPDDQYLSSSCANACFLYELVEDIGIAPGVEHPVL